MDDQWRWHAAFRDSTYHMYRTSYQDHIQGREVCCQRTAPSGYQGHQARLRHEVLFGNTAFDDHQEDLRTDPYRVKLPDFTVQMKGLPAYTPNPEGMRPVPTAKTIPKGPNDYLESPWATSGMSAFNILSHRMDAKPPPPRPYEMEDSLDTLQSTRPFLPKDLPDPAPVRVESDAHPEREARRVTLDLAPRDYARRLTSTRVLSPREVLQSSLVEQKPKPEVCVAPELRLPPPPAAG